MAADFAALMEKNVKLIKDIIAMKGPARTSPSGKANNPYSLSVKYSLLEVLYERDSLLFLKKHGTATAVSCYLVTPEKRNGNNKVKR